MIQSIVTTMLAIFAATGTICYFVGIHYRQKLATFYGLVTPLVKSRSN